nr:hypothetical protein REQ54_02825 [Rhizobium sp. Q54]
MTYLAWGILVEGNSDFQYYEVLIPRVLEEILSFSGVRPITVAPVAAIRVGSSGRSVEKVAEEICSTKEAYHIFFIHADTGGRSQQRGIASRSSDYCKAANELCGFRLDRCVEIIPRHETEAWALCDADAVLETIGYRGGATDLGLPQTATAAETLRDPKAVLADAIAAARSNRRRGSSLRIPLSAIAQRPSLDKLRMANSFSQFENSLRSALISLGLLPQPQS